MCMCIVVLEGGSLSLTSITRYDAGVYSCHAENGVPPVASKRVRLDVTCMFCYLCSVISGVFRISQGGQSPPILKVKG